MPRIQMGGVALARRSLGRYDGDANRFEDATLNILFVCLGNICRSPLAAGITKRLYEERGITGVIESAGTSDWNLGSPADPRTVRAALESGVDVRSHRARQIRLEDFDRFDLIVVMDGSNHRDVIKIAPESMRSKVRMLLKNSEGQNADVPDPYRGDEKLYRSTFELINQGCVDLVDDLDSK